MGKPAQGLPASHGEFIAVRSQPRELKHLSTWRKRKQDAIPLVAASERGTA